MAVLYHKNFMMPQKIQFTSLGCSRNLVDTEVMLGLVLDAGYTLTDDSTTADVLVINTCGFLKESRDEAYDILDELFSDKKEGAKVVVTGCMVKKEKANLKARFPDIFAMLGSGDVAKILDAIESETPQDLVSSEKSYLQEIGVPRALATPSHYAYLKIAEGCAKRCAFCIIPQLKGVLKSKPLPQVVDEFCSLIDQGVKEVVMIAQDLGDYGKDLPDKPTLEHLLRDLLKEEGDFWIRLLYLYPDEITDELIEVLASDSRICPYIDIPLQHINDAVLKGMRRKTSREQIIQIIDKLRQRLPHIVIRSSLMVGFPGETDTQFEELLEFVREAKLDHVGVFKYSKEEESFSAKMPGHLSESVKQARYDRLMQLQQEVVEEKNRCYLGKTLKVLVEGYHPESDLLMWGRFYGQAPDVDGTVIINDTSAVTEFGTFYDVEITDVAGYDLVGTANASAYV